MTRDEVKEVFKKVTFAYSRFEVSSEKLDFWFEQLKDQDAETVFKNVDYHIKTSPFPPTIAEIRKHVVGRDIPSEFVLDMSAGEEDWN